MKKIKSWDDVKTIIQTKADVRDRQNNVIPFVRFLNFKLIELLEIIDKQDWSYEVDY